MADILANIKAYLESFYFPNIGIADVLDIILISYLLYHIMLWIKTSRAWTLLKGILVVGLFLVVAAVCHLNTILWFAKNLINVFLLAFIVLFQPELRGALDELGRKQILRKLFSDSGKQEQANISDKSIFELVGASVELGRAKTGALIVIENHTRLGDIVKTGILVDATITKQLLINIFEKNTPLHDGAVVISGDKITAATCYLPLTASMDINKELGTRHRAGLGISEISDSLTIIVSEETGAISVAKDGELYRNLSEEKLRNLLMDFKEVYEEKSKSRIYMNPLRKKKRKGGSEDEK